MNRSLLAVALAVLLSGCGLVKTQNSVGFIQNANQVQITLDGETVATYVHTDPDVFRPFIKHAKTPTGVRVTRQQPPPEGQDHPTFHPGIFLTFADINGNDYWRGKARVVHDGFIDEPGHCPGGGTFTARSRYLNQKGDATVCTETTKITVLPRKPGYFIISESSFSSNDHELAFGDQEEFGFGVRVAIPMAVNQKKGGRILDSKGRVNGKAVWGKQADWCEYSGILEGQRVGLVVMPSPGNFRRSWYHARDYGLLVANPFGQKALGRGEKSQVLVKKGKTFKLTFGVFVYAVGEKDEPDREAIYSEYLTIVGASAASELTRR